MCVQYVNTKFSNVNAIVNLCSKFYNKLTFENVIGIMTHFMYISYYIHIYIYILNIDILYISLLA